MLNAKGLFEITYERFKSTFNTLKVCLKQKSARLIKKNKNIFKGLKT
jgi:hypothetical protein